MKKHRWLSKKIAIAANVGLLLFATTSMFACSGQEDNLVTGGSSNSSLDNSVPGNYIVDVVPETQKLVRNPMAGWAIYGSAGVASDFWTQLDKVSVPELGTTVKASDYASILYIRTGWADLEPQEGVYAWDNNATIKMLIEGAKARGLKLAFRIVEDSRDKPRNFTPTYVRDAGAQGYVTQTGSVSVWSPYPDDLVFQAKYEKFIKAFAAKFDDPDVVDFIDGYGLGKWGEAHTVLYLNTANRQSVFDWITNLYLTNFKKVPLAINYHRLIGLPQEWASPNPDTKTLLTSAFNKGYMLRHDAFGMTSYYQSYEKGIVTDWFPTRPVIMEGGWCVNTMNYSIDPRGYKTAVDVRKGEYDDSKEAHVNVMDFRAGGEVQSWFKDAYSMVKSFIAEGGYRLYPDKLSLPKTVTNTTTIKIIHRWNNLGWGVCPNNLPQWNQKYKVAFAMLSKIDDSVKSIYIDSSTDPSKWLKGTPTTYEFSTPVKDVPAGDYTWAVAIVDVTKDNVKGLNISAKTNITTSGWLKLMDVTVK
ncbi:DUF4832 domain-containing protein [Parabacteroides sp. FAFU027]|uniref:DUF4832 domain-containing protein n=1 Tax=Parabacteroides sp. FAFU027 TaxID=2922715 RepID=UPI001FAEFF59|nr:DUF4832 domain-containing protein [Parabacteroides sp. FAFU027]